MAEITIVGAGVRLGVNAKGAPAKKPDGTANQGFGAILAAALGLAGPAAPLPQALPEVTGEASAELVPEGPATADPGLYRYPALVQARAVPVPEAQAAPPQVVTAPGPGIPGSVTAPLEPILESPGPIRQTPEPIRQSPEPIRQSPEPIRQSPEPIRQTPEPIRQTPEPIRQTPEPIRQSPEPIRQTPGPMRESPGPIPATPAPVRGPAQSGPIREQKRSDSVALTGSGSQVPQPPTLRPASEAPRTDPPPTPIAPHEFIEQVVKSVAKSPDGSYHMSVQLHPEHLGEVRLHVVVEGKEIQTFFLVESPEAGQALSQQGEQLRQGLQQAGLLLGGFQVETGAGGGSPQGRQAAPDGTGPDRRPRQRPAGDQTGVRSIGPATRSSARPGGLDTMA